MNAENERQGAKRPVPLWLIAAFVGGSGLVACLLFGVFAFFGFKGLTHHFANEAGASQALDDIAKAEATYHDQGKGPGGKRVYGDLAALSSAGLVDRAVGSGTNAGYTFRVEPSTTDPENRFWAYAWPVTPNDSGHRLYYMNEQGQVMEWRFDGGLGPEPGLPDASTCALPTGLDPLSKASDPAGGPLHRNMSMHTPGQH